MKLSFILFILPLVAAAAQDGNLHDSSPVEAANAAADRHHLRRVLSNYPCPSNCDNCEKNCAPHCNSEEICINPQIPDGGGYCAMCIVWNDDTKATF